MQRLILPLTLATLAGCSSQPPQDTDQLIGTLLTQPLSEQSLMREGDVISFQVVLPPTADIASRRSAQVEASCSKPAAEIMYLDTPQRTYFISRDHYGPPLTLPERFHAGLLSNPSFTAACNTLPQADWRKVKGDDAGPWVLIDRNSLHKDGDHVRFWAAYDEPKILIDPPYNAPYAQKREHYRVDCGAQTFSLLAGYDVDANNRVTDGQVDPKPPTKPIAGSVKNYLQLFQLACGASEQINALTPFKSRPKTPVATTQLPPINLSVKATLDRLKLPRPPRSLSYLEIVGTSTMKGKTSPVREELFLSTDSNSQQLMINTNGQGYEGQELSWRGLLPLVSQNRYRAMSENQTLTSLSFKGDWQRMPVGSTLSYTRQGVTNNSMIGQHNKELKITTCTVERELPANTLNASLSGNAKALDCSLQGDEFKRIDHLFYLLDYGYFFQASTDKNAFYYSDLRLQTVK